MSENDGYIYFIREKELLLDEHFVLPRTRDTVRCSIDGTLCVVAFRSDEVPDGWDDGMNGSDMSNYLNREEAAGVWYWGD